MEAVLDEPLHPMRSVVVFYAVVDLIVLLLCGLAVWSLGRQVRRLTSRPATPGAVRSLAGAGIRLLAAAALIFVPSMIWRGWDGAATWSPDIALALALLAALLLADAGVGVAVTVRRAHDH